MTREEAIARIKDHMIVHKMNEPRAIYISEALDMAIKTLEQQTTSFEWCTDCKEYDQEKHCCHRWSKVIRNTVEEIKQQPCDDCISRKSIKQKLQEHHDFFVNAYGGFSNLPRNDKSRVDEITNCIAMVVNEPPIQPKPKVGHWIKISPAEIYECDICGQHVMTKDICAYKYCHGCGAKMVESQEKER